MFVDPQSTDPERRRGHGIRIARPVGRPVGLLEPRPSRPQVANLVQCVISVPDQTARVRSRSQAASLSPVHGHVTPAIPNRRGHH
jgi:hypothetical protein